VSLLPATPAADPPSPSPPSRIDTAEATALQARLADRSPQQILSWALGRFGERLVLCASFSAEDVVLIDIAVRISRRFRIVTLDTGRLPEETYQVMEEVRQRYGVVIETFAPDSSAVSSLVQLKGPLSFRRSIEDRQECCAVRKVAPLARALAGADAWATGLRRAQGVTRTDVAPVEIDAAHQGRTKVNPLWSMTDAELWAYVDKHDVPKSALYARGYQSIGCAPCTRAVQPGEDARAGRWWWEAPEHKECGLHARR
jgi:phosphoadenosine phosphosulfate reductase